MQGGQLLRCYLGRGDFQQGGGHQLPGMVHFGSTADLLGWLHVLPNAARGGSLLRWRPWPLGRWRRGKTLGGWGGLWGYLRNT